MGKNITHTLKECSPSRIPFMDRDETIYSIYIRFPFHFLLKAKIVSIHTDSSTGEHYNTVFVILYSECTPDIAGSAIWVAEVKAGAHISSLECRHFFDEDSNVLMLKTTKVMMFT